MSQRIIESNQKRSLLPKKEAKCSLRETLPSMYELPSEEVGESGLPDEFHVFQSQLLRETFQPLKYSADEVFVGTDINLYFDETHTRWYRRPDWFASVGVSRFYNQTELRLSYVVWQEGVSPLVVIELLSPSTEKEDLGQVFRDPIDPKDIPSKWDVYEKILRVPFYFTYDHLTQQIYAFRLEGDVYVSCVGDNDGRFLIANIGLYLGLWEGSYQSINETWIRWFDEQGNLIPTPLERESQEKERERVEKERERAEKERERAEKERERAEKERERAEKEALADKLATLNAKLLAMGINPDNL